MDVQQVQRDNARKLLSLFSQVEAMPGDSLSVGEIVVAGRRRRRQMVDLQDGLVFARTHHWVVQTGPTIELTTEGFGEMAIDL